MAGVDKMPELLAGLSPRLSDVEYVFATFVDGKYGDYAELSPLATFAEREGLTLVIDRATADAWNVSYEGTLKCITLSVHSSLNAVGLTAAVSSKLRDHGISANVIAAFYHDHIFVPAAKAEQAMEALNELSR